jgi:GTP cyclohydrolase IA
MIVSDSTAFVARRSDNSGSRLDHSGSRVESACRHGHPVDLGRIERAIREILFAVGEDPDRDGLRETPQRVARAYRDMLAGLQQEPGQHLSRVFDAESDDLVIVSDIQFSSLCEHHLLPFLGKVHVAYIPADNQVVGLSKLARTVEVFARRPQVQERLTTQIADALVEHLNPLGVLVIVEAEHLCMKVRGVNQCASNTVTKASRGILKTDAASRQEVLSLLRPSGSRG